MNIDADNRSSDDRPVPSSLVALEVSLLASAQEHEQSSKRTALVVVSDADERSYVSEALRQRRDLEIVSVGTVAAALEAAARHAPLVLVVTHDERAVVRHLPAVPAVVLSEDVTLAQATIGVRLAPNVVLRGAFREERLLEVVASLLREGDQGRVD